MHNIFLIVVGAVVGAIARYIGPGKAPLVGSMLFGAIGAAGGQFIGRLSGFYRGSESADFITALVGSVLLVVLYHAAALRRRVG